MRDIWAFLLQTLTASGVAVLLLAVKRIFRDKLSPRWQFAVWGLLGLVLLIPAGLGGRYVLFNWSEVVEVLKTLCAGRYDLTTVIAAVPMPPKTTPAGLFDWLFLLYLAGVVLLLCRSIFAYIRLRLLLRDSAPASVEMVEKIRRTETAYKLKACGAVEVEGLDSAFVCGLISPVLVLPAGVDTDEKVLLHELLHLKYRDVLWGIVIGFFRCIHWCNPLLWYCANRAGNDMESLCDQRVLERLEGEARRDYGRILLDMTNEKYARTPGTSSAANGGKNIRGRIEAIARFRRYPQGMGLASACVILVLAVPLVAGTRISAVVPPYVSEDAGPIKVDCMMSKARARSCTTLAGALDTYGKSVLTQSGFYRAMCTPLAEQSKLAQQLKTEKRPIGAVGLDPEFTNRIRQEEGYWIYNLVPAGKNSWTAQVVVMLEKNGQVTPSGEERRFAAVQNVRAEREGDRWVVIPQDRFQVVNIQNGPLKYGHMEDLPSTTYTGTGAGVQVELHFQTVCVVNNHKTTGGDWLSGPAVTFDTVPKPDAEFDEQYDNSWSVGTYVGAPEKKRELTKLGIVYAPVFRGEARPELSAPNALGKDCESYATSEGEQCVIEHLEPDWDGVMFLGGGGGGGHVFDKDEASALPDYYAVNLYLNGKKAAEFELERKELAK